MIKAICDRCGKESKEFYGYDEENNAPIVTFLENEAPWHVDFAKPNHFILVQFPGKVKKGEDREIDWKTMCPDCIEEFWVWFEGHKKKGGE